MKTFPKKRIEILAEAVMMPRLAALAERLGATGYTILPTSAAHGWRGHWTPNPLSAALAAEMIIIVCDADRAESLLAEAGRLLESHARMILLSDVEVLRGEDY